MERILGPGELAFGSHKMTFKSPQFGTIERIFSLPLRGGQMKLLNRRSGRSQRGVALIAVMMVVAFVVLIAVSMSGACSWSYNGRLFYSSASKRFGWH